ncbi:TetR/AcrR family transcriptional regulator [Streptomyces oceani]|uniref:HTH tetR-type domain-containing protein n=1 Tax=Streptomyces oceani TaxID=1075402 RepID=A0A1E7JRE7_9ACTN|nr:TetR/AcrR family transcriptional regulator [Streptomyces oceani]OEU91355.1 hypothetical protein AN216_25325 [Streptomyces oceani]
MQSKQLNARAADPRVRRSERALQIAVLDLVGERDLESITIADITRRAGVGRATFYLHYKDRDDALLAAVEESVAEVARRAAQCCPTHFTAGAVGTPEPLVSLFVYFHENIRLYRVLFGPDGSARLAHRVRIAVTEQITQELADLDVPAPSGRGRLVVTRAARAAFLAGALLGTVAAWLEADDPPHAQEVADEVWVLLTTVTATG